MADSDDAWLRRGIAAARSGQAEQARQALLRVIAADQHNLQAWYWLSRVVEAPEERQICLENVLALDPGHTAVQVELAELRAQEAHRTTWPSSAEEELLAAAALEPLACPYCGAFTEAEARLCPACDRALYRREPRQAGHSIWSLGLAAAWFALANWLWLVLAGGYFWALLSAPAESDTLTTLAELLGHEGRLPLADVPALAPILLSSGLALVFGLVVAWGLYRRFRPFYWLTVGLVCLAPLAIVYQLVTAETVPWPSLLIEGALFILVLVLASMAYEEYQWVERRLSAALDRDIDSPSSLYARGREHAAGEMWAKAAAHWSRAVALSPGHPEYRLALATAYLRLDRPEQAVEHLRAAQRIEPNNARVQELLEQTELQ